MKNLIKTEPDYQLNEFTRSVLNQCIKNEDSLATTVELRNGSKTQVTFERGVHGTFFVSTSPNMTGMCWSLNGNSTRSIDFDLFEISDANC